MSCAFSLLSFLGLCSNEGTLSSVNFVRGPIEPACAVREIDELDSFQLVSERPKKRRHRAVFSVAGTETMLLNIHQSKEGTADVYLSITPEDPGDPLRKRGLMVALREADEAVFLNCTEDGRAETGGTVILQGQQE